MHERLYGWQRYKLLSLLCLVYRIYRLQTWERERVKPGRIFYPDLAAASVKSTSTIITISFSFARQDGGWGCARWSLKSRMNWELRQSESNHDCQITKTNRLSSSRHHRFRHVEIHDFPQRRHLSPQKSCRTSPRNVLQSVVLNASPHLSVTFTYLKKKKKILKY